jgi:RimJ/RimL family protein N-acetyltransferase
MVDSYFFAAALADGRHKALMAKAVQNQLIEEARTSHSSGSSVRRAWTRWRAGVARVVQSKIGPRTNARPASPAAPAGRPVRLPDGSTVLVRPVEATDAPLLAEGFERLSPRSRELRFLRRKDSLSPAELRYFTDIDHHDHEALAAVNELDGRGVGIARFIRDEHDPEVAEVAVTVVDDWHGRGVGTELLNQLINRAEGEGIRRFTALISDDNAATLRLLRKVNLDVELVGRDTDTLQYLLSLVPAPPTARGDTRIRERW